MSSATDGHLDQLVKAGWLAIGLSQSDVAEVLGATFQQAQTDGKGSIRSDGGRLVQVAEALDMPADLFDSHAAKPDMEEPDHSSPENLCSLQSLLELRLLRAFHELRDHRTKRLLIRLAEQIIKRQANACGDVS